MDDKQHTKLGIDTIEVVIDTPIEIIENNVIFQSKTGIKIGELKHKQGKTHGYRLNINLPKCIRTSSLVYRSIAVYSLNDRER